MDNFKFVYSPTNINYNAASGTCTKCGLKTIIIDRDKNTNWPKVECPNRCFIEKDPEK